jgi:hypothetical protein
VCVCVCVCVCVQFSFLHFLTPPRRSLFLYSRPILCTTLSPMIKYSSNLFEIRCKVLLIKRWRMLLVLSQQIKKNSVVWVRKRTIPTERPPLVGEVIAKFLWIEGATWSAWRIPTAVFWVSRREPLLFYQVAPQLYSRGWVDPVPDPLHFFFW